MYTSPFEAEPPEAPDPPESELADQRADEELKNAVKGVMLLAWLTALYAIMVAAVMMVVAVLCFICVWICQMYLLGRLFLFTSSMLRLCMDEPRRVHHIDETQKPDTPSPEDHKREDEQENESRIPETAENVHGTEEDAEQFEIVSNHGESSHQEVTFDTTTQAGRRPELFEEWRPGYPTDGTPGIEERWTHDRYDELQQEDMPPANTEEWGWGEETERTVPTGSRMAPSEQQQHMPRYAESSKPSKENQRAQEQRSWLDDMISAPTSRPGRTMPTRDKATENRAPGNPWNCSADQLAEAAEFLSSATRGGGKKPTPHTRTSDAPTRSMNQPTPSRPSRASQPTKTYVPKAKSTPLDTTGPRGRTSVRQPGVVQRSASKSPPPHVKWLNELKAQGAISQETSNDLSDSAAPTVQAAQVARAENKPPETSAANQVIASEEDKQPTEVKQKGPETSPHQPSVLETLFPAPETRPSLQGPGKLRFYDGTPPVTSPAPGAMSVEVLKSFRGPMRFVSDDQIESARLLGVEDRSFMTNGAPKVRESPHASSCPPAVPTPEKFSATNAPFKNTDRSLMGSPKKSDGSPGGSIDLNAEESQSTQQELPSAAEFEAAFLASQGQQIVSEKTPESYPSREANHSGIAEVADSSSNQTSILRHAVRVLKEQAHAKQDSSSTYATAREDATPARHATKKDQQLSLIDLDDAEQETTPKKSAKLTPNAPAFFAPTQTATQAAEMPPDAHVPAPSLFVPSAAAAGGIPTPYDPYKLPESPFIPDAPPVNMAFQSTPHAPYAGVGHAANPYDHTSSMSSFAPSAHNPYAYTPSMPPFVHAPAVPAMQNPTTPGMVAFPPAMTMPATPHSTGHIGIPSWTAGHNVVPPPQGPQFFGDFTSMMSGAANASSAALHNQYAVSPYQLSNNQLRPPAPPNAPRTVPPRRPSLAVPIVQPPAPVVQVPAIQPPVSRPHYVHPKDTVLWSTYASTPTSGKATAKPPGLGEAQATPQATFDALLSESDTPVPKAKSNVYDLPDAVEELTEAKQDVGAPPDRETANAMLDSFKEFSKSLNLPELKPQHAEGNLSPAREDTRSDGSKSDKNMEMAQEVPATISTGANESKTASSTLQDETDAAKAEELTASEKKRGKREEKKAARDTLTEAWCSRDEARKKVKSTWTIEGAMELRETTRIYNEAREKLESLMGNGKLNDEDARDFPRFADLEVKEPKNRPEGYAEIQKRRKEEKAAQTLAANGANTGIEPETTDESSQQEAHRHDLKEKLITAYTLRNQALESFNEPRPQSNISYDTWKKTREARLERATKLYRNKRDALKAAYPDGLPNELVVQFPEL